MLIKLVVLMLHSTLQQVAWLRGSRETYFIKVKGIEPHCAGTNLFFSSNFIWTFIFTSFNPFWPKLLRKMHRYHQQISSYFISRLRIGEPYGNEQLKTSGVKMNWHIFFPYFKNVTELKMKQLQYQIVEQLYEYISRN